MPYNPMGINIAMEYTTPMGMNILYIPEGKNNLTGISLGALGTLNVFILEIMVFVLFL